MKPQNLKMVTAACKKLEWLQHHYANFVAIMSDNLPEDQFDKQQKYAVDLQKEIRKLEKEIAEL